MLVNNELEHHGILGQKWGVRRYQNYDGSYTRAGLKRYNKALGDYTEADEKYEQAKKEYKEIKEKNKGDEQAVSSAREKMNKAKWDRKIAKIQVNKDYKHLSLDKKADQGKLIYAKGGSISANGRVGAAMGFVGALGALEFGAAIRNYAAGGNSAVTDFLATSGLVNMVVSEAVIAKKASDTKKLRAYYGHSSTHGRS